MKRILLLPSIIILEALLMTFSVCAQDANNTANSAINGRILVVYVSRTGNTRAVANEIHSQTGGDIAEIIPLTAYPRNYNEVLNQAQQEKREQARPPIKEMNVNIANYDVIFLGYPIWWGSIPMCAATFLESYNLTGKTIIPFCTSGSTGISGSLSAIEISAPKAKVQRNSAMRFSNNNSLKTNIAAWLKTLHL
jgi:flavodoxin